MPHFKMNELKEIKGLLNDGLSISDIAELMGRSKKSIENLMSRQKWTRGRFKEEKQEDMNSWDSILNPKEPSLEFPETNHKAEVPTEAKEEVAVMHETIKPVKEKTLDDFTPREIFLHLDKLGYEYPGGVVCNIKVKVNLEDILKNG